MFSCINNIKFKINIQKFKIFNICIWLQNVSGFLKEYFLFVLKELLSSTNNIEHILNLFKYREINGKKKLGFFSRTQEAIKWNKHKRVLILYIIQFKKINAKII